MKNICNAKETTNCLRRQWEIALHLSPGITGNTNCIIIHRFRIMLGCASHCMNNRVTAIVLPEPQRSMRLHPCVLSTVFSYPVQA